METERTGDDLLPEEVVTTQVEPDLDDPLPDKDAPLPRTELESDEPEKPEPVVEPKKDDDEVSSAPAPVHVPKETMILSQKLAKEQKRNEQRFTELGGKIGELVELVKNQGSSATNAQRQQNQQAMDDIQADLTALEGADYDSLSKPLATVMRKLSAQIRNGRQDNGDLTALQKRVNDLYELQQRAEYNRTLNDHWRDFKDQHGFDGRKLWDDIQAKVMTEEEDATDGEVYRITRREFDQRVKARAAELKAKPATPAAPSPKRTMRPSVGTETVSPNASGTQRPGTAARRRTPDSAIFG